MKLELQKDRNIDITFWSIYHKWFIALAQTLKSNTKNNCKRLPKTTNSKIIEANCIVLEG